MKRSLGLFFFVAACGPQSAYESTHSTGSYTRPVPDDAATVLARRVGDAAGAAHWNEVAGLRFHFVVTNAGERVADVAHDWDVRAGTDHVVWTEDGAAHDVVVDLAHAPSGEGYERWVNDTYWLLLPLKLLDRGVHRALEAPREYGGRPYQILHISFDHVGLTPGDQYWLFIDESTARIERWEMQLEGQEPPPRGTSFTDYRPAGPLTLALDHATDDATRHILFENVEVR